MFKLTRKKLWIGVLVPLLMIGGAAAAGMLWCPSASERANAITMEDIQREAKDYERSKKMAKAGKELAATPLGSADHEEALNTLISLLDPNTQAYIKALPREDRLAAITIKLQEENAATEKQIARQKAKERLCWSLTFGNYDLTVQ
jgi:hypothetical protein